MRSIGELFSNTAEQNNDRILMAHSVFEPAANEGVQFWRTIAKDGKVSKPDPLWTKQRFDESYKRLHDIREKLTKLRPRLTPRTFHHYHYLYGPASSWVPSGDERRTVAYSEYSETIKNK